MRMPASATSMARVNGQRQIRNEEKIQQNQHRITTPQLTSLERDRTRYRMQEKVVGLPAEKKQTNIFVFVRVQSILTYVSLSYFHNYMMSIAEPFSLDFACRWWPCFPFGRAMMEVYNLLLSVVQFKGLYQLCFQWALEKERKFLDSWSKKLFALFIYLSSQWKIPFNVKNRWLTNVVRQ